ncbi:branched-chain amino acid ABC transporter permease [Desulfomonile tiedjei]|uniref:Amino acid/amide ABC transporter membrane protein 1, HAAT family n=1 Tax=Desulfomonile tiedjei (strain ATCC 49306 / DSM 6799 / DCB-1) TaxID=706587 RepID=I4C9V0_DESTA|nr:branched-chain amino acid ABC transporter permease [Desulfomonile tiedjei]AFM26341.1 amino acid/amide ABC transporter membrane protein 1, HAAT family [Desulfomonile tiedjei DSM 6799]
MDIIPQIIVSGLAAGGVYGLIALGFVLIYKATSILNLATGEFMTVGAFICFTGLTYLSLPFSVAFIGTLLFAAFLGIIVERLMLRPLIGEPIISVIMVTIGLGSILKGLTHMIWSPEYRSFPRIFPPQPLDLGFAIVPSGLLWGFISAIIFTILFTCIFRYTRTGLAMRATAANQQAALSMGISVKRVFAISWSFAAIAAAVGGVIIGNISGISIHLGHIGLKVLSVIILGGLDSIVGAIVGGFIIGLLENFAGVYLDSYFGGGVKEVVPFVVLVIIIMIRPYGIFGKPIIERV